jgi:tetratricopeptide (TPR) repeat protein
LVGWWAAFGFGWVALTVLVFLLLAALAVAVLLRRSDDLLLLKWGEFRAARWLAVGRNWPYAYDRLRDGVADGGGDSITHPNSLEGWPVATSWRVVDDAETIESAAISAPASSRRIYGRLSLPTRYQVAAVYSTVSSLLKQTIEPPIGTRRQGSLSRDVVVDEASRCSALASALRRAGRSEQAVTLQTAACLLFSEAGDTRGKAAASNALGIALAEIGAQEEAVDRFELAWMLFRDLGDEQEEGKVLANLGVAKQRAGDVEAAVTLLQQALTKLHPDSDAHRRVERRLIRAG